MRKKTKVERRKGSWVSVPYTKGDYLKEYLPYGILVAFFVNSYLMFATMGGLTGETVKLFTIYAIIAFVITIILFVILFIAAILADISYYGSIVFLIISGLIIIYLMLSGHQGAAFGWPGVVSIVFLILLFIVLIGFVILGPLLIPALVISAPLYSTNYLLPLFALIFVFLLIVIGLSYFFSEILGYGDLLGDGFLAYLSYAAGFYSSCIAANFVFTTAVVKNILMTLFSLDLLEQFFKYINSFLVELGEAGPLSMIISIFKFIIPVPIDVSGAGTPYLYIITILSLISSILFGLLCSLIYSRISEKLE